MRALSLITSGGVAFFISMGVAKAQTAPADTPAGKAEAAPKAGQEAKPKSGEEANSSKSETAEPKNKAAKEAEESSGQSESETEPSSDSNEEPEGEKKTVDLEEDDERAEAVSADDSGTKSSDEKASEKPEKAKKKPKPKPAAPPPPPPDYSKLPQTYHLRHIDIALGPRISSATHDGLQPYMYEPITGELVGRVSATVTANEPWALSVLVQGSGFKRSADARSIPTELTVVQFGAGLEARYHMHHRLFAYGRVVGGAEMASMSYGDDYLDDADVASATNWAFFGDANLGFAFRFAGSSDGRKRAPRAWVFVEGGGRLATVHKAELEVDEDDGPNRADPVVLPSFSTNGFMGSGGLMISF